jgi:hypothetical protein
LKGGYSYDERKKGIVAEIDFFDFQEITSIKITQSPERWGMKMDDKMLKTETL